jgi:hypothetical protein
LAGLFFGLAAGVKLVPLLLLPVFARGRRWRTGLTGLLILTGSYLPHLLAVGAMVVGFLPGYWGEEGYDGDRRFALFVWLPKAARTVASLAVALCLALLALLRSRREPVLLTCCWLYGCSFLVATPIYAWYVLPFVVIVIMAGRLEWLGVWAAGYAAFVFDHQTYVQTAAYGAALLLVLVVTVRRSRAALT